MKTRLASFFKSFSAPEIFLILVLFLGGIIAILAVPLSAGYDEETHIVRAWQMAHFDFVPNDPQAAKLPFPAIYFNHSYRRQPLVQAVPPDFLTSIAGKPLDAEDYVYATIETRSVYSPALLLPQALVLRYLGLSLRLPALTVYYAVRLAGLLSYLFLSWLAIRITPFGKWMLAILAVAPMVLYQAATINTDAITNGVGFLFLGGTLALARKEELTWRDWAALAVLIALIFMSKVNLIFLVFLPFLLIPPAKFRMKHGYLLLIGLSLVLFAVEVGGWNLVAYAHFTRALEGADPAEQVRFILAGPLRFIGIIAGDIWANTRDYLLGWVGIYGYNYWPVPGLTYLLYPLAVLGGLWLDRKLPSPDRRTRLVLGGLFVMGYLLTIVSLYVAFTPAKSLVVEGVQGRYFTPIFPLLFLALIPPHSSPAGAAQGPGSKPLRERLVAFFEALQGLKIPSAIPAALAAAGLVLYLGGMLLSYHVNCGAQYYRLDLCTQPEYKNWAPGAASSPPVSPALSLTQEIVPACSGMKELLIWVNSRGTDPEGTTTLLLRAPQQEKDVLQQTFKNSDLPQFDWLIVTFKPEWQSQGQLYILTLTGSSPDGMRVAYSLKPEYLAGKLYENNTAIGQDVIFQYGCVAGLQSLLGAGGQ